MTLQQQVIKEAGFLSEEDLILLTVDEKIKKYKEVKQL